MSKGRRFRIPAAALLLCLVTLLIGCEQDQPAPGPRFGTAPAHATVTVYSLAVRPLQNPARLTRIYQPLLDYLNAHLQGARIELVTSRDYADFETKYAERGPAFLLPNAWQTLEAEKHGYNVIATAGDREDSAGIFLVRKDSGIRQPSDLKGKAVSYPSRTALAACILPQYYLYTQGIDVNRDIENRYVGTQDSSIMNVWMKLTAAGATWHTPWRNFQKEHPREAADLMIAWETEPLINNAFMARDDIPAAVVVQVRALLLGLDQHPEGKRILAALETKRFLPATDADYERVRDFLTRFEKLVRPINAP